MLSAIYLKDPADPQWADDPAMQEFQEQALLPFDEVGAKVLTPLGFNPSWEAIAPQLAIVAIAIVALLLARRRAGAASAAAE